MAPRLIETDAQMSSNGNVMTMYSRDSCTQTQTVHQIGAWTEERMRMDSKWQVHVLISNLWHLFSFFEDRLWDCHSPNWQRDQLNACTFSTRGELKRWPCHRQRRLGTGGARSDDLQDVGTPRSVLSRRLLEPQSGNVKEPDTKIVVTMNYYVTKILLSMNEIERERDRQD